MSNTGINAVLATVSQSFLQDSIEGSLYGAAPKAQALGQHHDVPQTTYSLPDLKNALMEGELVEWESGKGMSLPEHDDLAKVDVTVNPKGLSTRGLPVSTIGQDENIYADLRQMAPVQMSKLISGLDKRIARHLSFGAANYGTFSFTGTSGEGLDQASDHANQTPLQDVDTAIKAFRPLAGYNGLQLECWMSDDIAGIWSRHLSLTGFGAGGGVADGISRDAVAEELMRLLRFQEVRIFDRIEAGNRSGQSLDIDPTAEGLFFVGLFDRRQDRFDIRPTSANRNIKPDGALCVFEARQMGVFAEPESKETLELFGRAAVDIKYPRTADSISFGTTARVTTSGANLGFYKTSPAD